MGISGQRQTDGQNGSYDNRYIGVCIKGWGIHGVCSKKEKENKRDKDKHKTSNKAWDWEDDLNDADLSRLRILLKEETNKKRQRSHIWA